MIRRNNLTLFSQNAADSLLAMAQTHLHLGEFLVDMLSQMLGRVDGAVLSARTAEAEHQRRETAFHIALHMGIGQLIDVVEKTQNLAIILQEFLHSLVQTCQMLVGLIASWVMGASTVEDIASTIAALILRNPFLIAKAENADYKFPVNVLRGLPTDTSSKLRQGDKPLQHLRHVGIGIAHTYQLFLQALNGWRNALNEMGLTLKVTSITVSAQHLHQSE